MKNPPPAGDDSVPILMSMDGKLVFTAEGQWLHDGVPVTHEKIRDYFSRGLRRSVEHGGYVIEAGGRCVAVEVEDTPVVVRTLETSAWPWLALLSGGIEEPFDAGTLEVSREGVFYCRVNSGAESARLLRPAWQALLPYVFETAGGGFEFRHADADHGSPKVFRIHSR